MLAVKSGRHDQRGGRDVDANDIFQAAMVYVVKWSPVIFGIAVISFADLIIDFTIKIFKRAPTYDLRGRRTRR